MVLPAAVLAAVLLASSFVPAQKPAAAKKPATTPLVRADLLAVPPPEPAAVIRDIFSPGRAVAPPPEAVAAAVPVKPAAVEPETSAEAVPESPPLDVKYIGYVTSKGKMVALVVSDGLALAVRVGEEVFPGVKVVKIARDRIEVVESDGKRTSVPIQGEHP